MRTFNKVFSACMALFFFLSLLNIYNLSSSNSASNVYAKNGCSAEYPNKSPEMGVFGQFCYKDIGGSKIKIDPNWVNENLITLKDVKIGKKTIKSLTMHKLAKNAFEDAFSRINNDEELSKLLESYNGLWNPRYIEGTNNLSKHSWGIAIDLNASTNQQGKNPSEANRKLWEKAFKPAGFDWGGNWNLPYTDGMHYELPENYKLPYDENHQSIIKGLDDSIYINQINDVPSDFDGRWACAPCSAVMFLAYFGKIIPVSYNSHVGNKFGYGYYVSKKYTYTRSDGSEISFDNYYECEGHDGYGAWGYIWKDDNHKGSGYGVSSNIVKYVREHEIIIKSKEVDKETAKSVVIKSIKNDIPLIARTGLWDEGHYVLIVGYSENNNDFEYITFDPGPKENIEGDGKYRKYLYEDLKRSEGDFFYVYTLSESPTHVAPCNGCLVSAPVAFIWKRVEGADKYGLYIRDTVTNQLVYDNDNIQGDDSPFSPTNQSITPDISYVSGRTYKWNMRAHNSYGLSDYTSAWIFTIKSSDGGGNCTIIVKASYTDNNKNEISIPAPFTLEGPNGFKREDNAPKTYSNLSPGWYSITWKNFDEYTVTYPPNGKSRQELKNNETKTFSARYKKIPTGKIKVIAECGSEDLRADFVLKKPDGSKELHTTPYEDKVQVDERLKYSEYTVIWQKLAGYNLPNPSTQTEKVEIDKEKVFTGRYEKDQSGNGKITVQATLDGVPWEGFVNYIIIPGNILGKRVPDDFYVSPGSYYLEKLSGGPKRVVNGITQEAKCEINPPSLTISVGEEKTFTIIFTFPKEGGGSETGTVEVDSNIKASFDLIGPGGRYSETTSWRKTDLPTGTYEINWNDVSGYNTPPSEQKFLSSGSTISFYGYYTPSSGGGGNPPPDKKVTLTLYVHENSSNGPIVPGANVSGYDGNSNPFSKTTNSSGYVEIEGVKGNWSFKITKSGYKNNSWNQSINSTCTKHAYIEKDSGGGGGNPPPSAYEVGNWISIGSGKYYYDNPCGRALYGFDFENGFRIEEKKYCEEKWWYKIWMYDDDGVKNQYVWIRGIDINSKINAPLFTEGSTREFKKGAYGYDKPCGTTIDYLKYDGNKFEIKDKVYRCGSWWYKVYVGPWSKYVWFKESDIL